jgi:hypothetical protein
MAEKADYGGVRASEDANYGAFGAARSSDAVGGFNFGDDLVAVHCAIYGVGRNEEIAVELRDRCGGNDEAVSVVVEYEAAFCFIAGKDICGGLGLRVFDLRDVDLPIAGAALGLRSCWGFFCGVSFGDAVAASGEFFDGVAFFEFGEDFEEGAAVGFSEVQAAGDFIGGDRLGFNL